MVETQIVDLPQGQNKIAIDTIKCAVPILFLRNVATIAIVIWALLIRISLLSIRFLQDWSILQSRELIASTNCLSSFWELFLQVHQYSTHMCIIAESYHVVDRIITGLKSQSLHSMTIAAHAWRMESATRIVIKILKVQNLGIWK